MKKNIAVLAGGNSSESIISLQSSEQVIKNLDKEIYNAFKILIKGDEWEVTSNLYCGLMVNKNDFSITENGVKIKFDAVFIAIHGTPGEDGKIQSYFEMLNIPYTGCNVLTSALTFNKYYCNTFLRQFEIPVANSLMLTKNSEFDVNTIASKIGFPMFIKPNEGGSSFGISKAKQVNEIEEAIKKAFKESDQIIIEQFISGREITCGIYKSKKNEYIFPLTEIITSNDFFDFEAKYDPEKAQEITPASISDSETKQVQELASEIYDIIGCEGIVRADFILNNNIFYLLEINTIPGMTENSLVPQQIRAAGITEKEIYGQMIEEALNK